LSSAVRVNSAGEFSGPETRAAARYPTTRSCGPPESEESECLRISTRTGPGFFRVEEGGDHGPAPAHDVISGLDLSDEGIGLGRPDERNRAGIRRGGLTLGQKVGEVRRGDDQDVFPGAGFFQGRGQGLDRRLGLIAHEDRDDLGVGEDLLDKRDLDLNRMLLDLRPRDEVGLGDECETPRLADRLREGRVNSGGAERRREAFPRIDGTSVEAEVVGRADDDDRFIRTALDEGISISGGLAGIDMARMGYDQRPNFPGDGGRRPGVREEELDLGGQPGRVLVVELAGHVSRLDLFHRARDERGDQKRH
jgi:hypothetical protein